MSSWNYIAVHAYGIGSVKTETTSIEDHLSNLVSTYDPDYKQKWDQFPEQYKSGMANGIVVVEIEVSRLEGKKKLSQNKTERERNNIINALEASPNTNDQNIAAYMKKLGI